MAETYVVVVAHLAAKPGCEEALREVLTALVGPTRAEEGCVQYDLHVATDAPGEFVFYERWSSQAALEKHLGSEHLRATGAKAQDLAAGSPSIRTYLKIV